MTMEKRGKAPENTDLLEMIKQATIEGKVIVLNIDGFEKYANSHRDREGIIVVATGDQAVKLRNAMPDLLK